MNSIIGQTCPDRIAFRVFERIERPDAKTMSFSAVRSFSEDL